MIFSLCIAASVTLQSHTFFEWYVMIIKIYNNYMIIWNKVTRKGYTQFALRVWDHTHALLCGSTHPEATFFDQLVSGSVHLSHKLELFLLWVHSDVFHQQGMCWGFLVRSRLHFVLLAIRVGGIVSYCSSLTLRALLHWTVVDRDGVLTVDCSGSPPTCQGEEEMTFV